MRAARKTRAAAMTAAGVPSGRRRRGRPDLTIQCVPDRLAEDARLFLLVVERRQITYDAALDGLIRDALGSVDRLRSAAAAARACGQPVAEVDLLERAADRAEHRDRTRAGPASQLSGDRSRARPACCPWGTRG